MSQPPLRTDRIWLEPLTDEHLEYEVEVAHRRRLAAAARVPGLGFWVGFVDGERGGPAR
jgi:hypothetical protein